MDCKDESSANWLRDIAPKLVGWKGAVLYEKRRVELADEFARSATFTTMVGPETYMVVAPQKGKTRKEEVLATTPRNAPN